MMLARVMAILFALAVLAWLVGSAQRNGQRGAVEGRPDSEQVGVPTSSSTPGPVPETFLPSSKVVALPPSAAQPSDHFLFSSKSGMPLPAAAEPVRPPGRQ